MVVGSILTFWDSLVIVADLLGSGRHLQLLLMVSMSLKILPLMSSNSSWVIFTASDATVKEGLTSAAGNLRSMSSSGQSARVSWSLLKLV